MYFKNSLSALMTHSYLILKYLMSKSSNQENLKKISDVLLGHADPWNYYHGWLPQSNWKNLYTVMSEAELFRFNAVETARRVQIPTMMVSALVAEW